MKFTLESIDLKCGICGKSLFERLYSLIDDKLVCLTCYMKPEPEPVFCGKCLHCRFVDDGMWQGYKCASKPHARKDYLNAYEERESCDIKNRDNNCQEFELHVLKPRRLGRWISKLLMSRARRLKMLKCCWLMKMIRDL